MDVDALINLDSPVATDNIKKAAPSNPDAVAESMRIGQRFGVPPVAVEQNPEPFKLRARIDDGLAAIQDPKMGQFLENPNAAKLAHDDYPILTKLGKALQVFGEVAAPGYLLAKQSVAGKVEGFNQMDRGFQAGVLEGQKGAAQAPDLLGLPTDTTKITDLEEQIKKLQKPEDGMFSTIGGMLGGLTVSAPMTLAGAAIGAPTVVGAGPAAMFAFSADQGMRAAGNLDLELSKLKTSGGTTIDPIARRTAALAYGTVVGRLNYMLSDKVSPSVIAGTQALARSIFGTIMKEPAVNQALVKSGLELGQAGLVGAGIFGLQEATKAASEDLAKMATDPEFKTVINDPERLKEVSDHVISSMMQGFALSTMLHLPGYGVNKFADSAYEVQTKESAAQLDQIVNLKNESKTFQRDPNLIQEFADSHGNPNLGVNAEVALTVYKENPGAFSFLPNFEEAATMAAQGGGDIKLPMAVYLKNISPELHEMIKGDVRVGEAPTPNEVQAMKDNPPNYVEIYHGTPWDFNQFGDEHFGKGEGNQSYGLGHYVTEHPGIAEFYKDSVTTINEKPTFMIGDREVSQTDPHDIAAMELHFNGGNVPAAMQAIERVRDYWERAGEAEKEARYKQALAELQRPLPEVTMRTREDLYPQVISGKLKVAEEEMSDLRKPLAEQNDRVKAAVAQAEKEAGPEATFYDRDSPFKEHLTDLEKYLGAQRVREIFIENGVKAHKYETTQSMDRGGELFDKTRGKFVTKDDLVAPANEFDTRPAHNYVVLEGKDIEITHKNGVEVKPLEPPKEIRDDPVAAQAFSETKDLVVQTTQAEAQANSLDALFKDAQAAGMTNVEYALYLRRLSKMQEAINDKAYQTALKEAKRRLSPEWKENTKRVEDEVEADLRTEPEMMALNYLQKGEGPDGPTFGIKLDKDATEKMLGDYAGNRADYPGDLPRGITQKDGLHPDDMARLFGYDSGRELLSAMSHAEATRAERGETWGDYRKRVIGDEVNRRMEAQYGKLDEAIIAAAQDAVLGAKQLDILSAELAQLAKLTGIEKPFSKAELDKAVNDIVASRTSGEFKLKDFQREAGKAGRQAEMALLKGKYDVAYMAKQRQMLMLKAEKEARAFEKETKNWDKLVKPFKKENVVKGVDQRYTDQIQQLLMGLGEKTFRDANELARGNPPKLDEFVQEASGRGQQLDKPTFFDDPQWQGQADKSIPNLTVDQKRDLHEFVRQLVFYGKREGKLAKAGELVELKDLVRDARTVVQGMELKGDNFDPSKVYNKPRKANSWWDSMNVRMERLFSWLDDRNSNGFFNTHVFRPLAEAQNRSLDLSKMVSEKFKALPRPEKMGEKINNKIFRDSEGNLLDMNKENLLVAALNMGNESNWSTFTRGWKVDPLEAQKMVNDHLTKADWDFVQGIWKIFEDDLFPLADQASRENTGVGLKKIEPREILTQHGKITGGYYPLVEHPDVLTQRGTDTINGFKPAGFQPYPTRGYTKRRTGVAYPVALELRPLHGRIAEMVHDISFRAPWENASKILKEFEVRKLIKDGMGEEYLKQINPWLDHIASRGGETNPLMHPGLTNMSRFMRENMVTMLIGFKLGTAVIHGGAAAANSLRETGLRNFIAGVHDSFQRNPATGDRLVTEAMAESGMLRNRKHAIDRDIGRILNEAIGEGGFWKARAAYANFATSFVSNLDLMSAVPTYLGAREHALSKGMSREDAIYFAEQTVRNAHGSNGMIDLPAIMRQGETMKWFTSFGGYFNHNYNQIRDAGRYALEGTKQVARGEIKTGFTSYAKSLGGILGYLVAGSIVHTLVRGSHGTSWEDDPGKWLGEGILNQLVSSQFLLRDVGFWASTGGKGKVTVNSPLNEVVTGVVKPGSDLYKMWHDPRGRAPKGTLEHLMQAPGWATGIGPTNYLTKMGAYMTDEKSRLPTDFWQWWRLALDAEAPKRGKH